MNTDCQDCSTEFETAILGGFFVVYCPKCEGEIDE